MKKKRFRVWDKLENGRIPTLMVAAVCLILAMTVHQTTVAEISYGYTSLFVQNQLPKSQRTLLAYDGDIDGLADKLDTAVTVELTVDGMRSIIEVSGNTVADALFSANIALGSYDAVSPSLNTQLTKYQDIVVTRREKMDYTTQAEIPYRTVYVYSPMVKPGSEVVEVEGQNGISQELYARMVSRGEVQEEILVSKTVIREPVNKRVLMGFKVKPVSKLDFGADFDDNGEPIGYAKVLRGQRAAGYSAPSGASTASGLPAKVGHVAVNPNVIPYGSKLYIQSPDGTFIYGYAIAADTGHALMGGKIGVDLFYDNYQDSLNNGIREVDIYVLE